jgi:hypothetical protein
VRRVALALASVLVPNLAAADGLERAFAWHAAGHLLGLPVTCTVDVERTPQLWTMACLGPVRADGKVPVEIVIRGDWFTREDGDLEFRTDYANARVVLRRVGTSWRQVSSTVDIKLKAAPR